MPSEDPVPTYEMFAGGACDATVPVNPYVEEYDFGQFLDLVLVLERFADVGALKDLPDENLREIEQFFEVYKRLEGDEEVEILGWVGLEETHELIRGCAQAYTRA